MKNPDMSPKAVFDRLRLASELRDLCIELGRSKKADVPPARPVQSSKNKTPGSNTAPERRHSDQ